MTDPRNDESPRQEGSSAQISESTPAHPTAPAPEEQATAAISIWWAEVSRWSDLFEDVASFIDSQADGLPIGSEQIELRWLANRCIAASEQALDLASELDPES